MRNANDVQYFIILWMRIFGKICVDIYMTVFEWSILGKLLSIKVEY